MESIGALTEANCFLNMFCVIVCVTSCSCNFGTFTLFFLVETPVHVLTINVRAATIPNLIDSA